MRRAGTGCCSSEGWTPPTHRSATCSHSYSQGRRSPTPSRTPSRTWPHSPVRLPDFPMHLPDFPLHLPDFAGWRCRRPAHPPRRARCTRAPSCRRAARRRGGWARGCCWCTAGAAAARCSTTCGSLTWRRTRGSVPSPHSRAAATRSAYARPPRGAARASRPSSWSSAASTAARCTTPRCSSHSRATRSGRRSARPSGATSTAT
mmetsp:Transcript_28052/g.69188  ORF Transcript_28052/g.69188 Transcript_28052/m.69188 type:complete len:204 (+) Transcript_28052:1564-2175(+)